MHFRNFQFFKYRMVRLDFLEEGLHFVYFIPTRQKTNFSGKLDLIQKLYFICSGLLML